MGPASGDGPEAPGAPAVHGPAPQAAVSVVLPTWQRRHAVAGAIASVRAQTFADWELLVADDGSADGTADMVEGLTDPRIRVLRLAHRGPAAARNAGIAATRAPLVAFLDSDDRWHPGHLTTLIAVLREDREAVLAATCLAPAPSAATTEVERVNYPEIALGGWSGGTSAIAVRREALLAAGGFDERLAVGEDSSLWLAIATQGPVARSRRQTVTIGRSEDSLSSDASARGLYAADPGASVAQARRLLDVRADARAAEMRRALDARARVNRAVTAATNGDRAGVRRMLDAARRSLPELDDRRDAVRRRARLVAGPEQLEGVMRLIDELWPEPVEQRTPPAPPRLRSAAVPN